MLKGITLLSVDFTFIADLYQEESKNNLAIVTAGGDVRTSWGVTAIVGGLFVTVSVYVFSATIG